MSYRIQQVIHAFEVGAGAKLIKFVLALIGLLTIATVYDLVAFRNLSTAEGMDAAQVAQRIADGKGFSTGFVRPFSLYLLQKKANEAIVKGADGQTNNSNFDPALLASHPDISNAPAFPVVLAAVLKLNPFGHPDTAKGKGFAIYTPDLWLAGFNQLLIVIGACLVFRLGCRLFDAPVGWVSGILFAGTEIFWRSSMTGVPVAFLAVIFLLLFQTMVSLQSGEDKGLVWRAALAGVLIAIAGLTRYSYAWLIIPFVVWMAGLPATRKGLLTGVVLLAFAIVWLPWLGRNYALSGTPFGTAGYAVYQGTPFFQEEQLERAFNPDFSTTFTGFFWTKLISNLRDIVEKVPRLGGTWASAFFLAGVLVAFRNPTLRRTRSFLLGSLFLLMAVQALGKTWLSTDSPELSGENLLLPLLPIMLIYGAGLFFVLLDQMGLPNAGYRLAAAGMFCAVLTVPLWLNLLPPHPSPIVYPPYYPPWIQEKASYMGEGDIMMTDIPWAVAWYGRGGTRLWLPLRYKLPPGSTLREDFYHIHNHPKPIAALYLTAKTLKNVEMRSLYDFARNEELDQDWNHFILGIFINKEVPKGFPLKRAPEDLMPEIFLTDSEHSLKK
jgi:hypothetical protein